MIKIPQIEALPLFIQDKIYQNVHRHTMEKVCKEICEYGRQYDILELKFCYTPVYYYTYLRQGLKSNFIDPQDSREIYMHKRQRRLRRVLKKHGVSIDIYYSGYYSRFNKVTHALWIREYNKKGHFSDSDDDN